MLYNIFVHTLDGCILRSFSFRRHCRQFLLISVWRRWKSTGVLIADLLLVTQCGLVYDNLVAGLGCSD